MDPWNALTKASGLLSTNNGMAQIKAAKKALELMAGNSDLVMKLCLACAENDVFTAKDLLSSDSSILNKLDKQGVPPLIYAVCFNHREIVELLLAFKVDVNEQDKLLGWTPVMWATNFDYEDLLERLISYGGDPLKKSNKTLKNAIDIAKAGSKSCEYFKIHGYIKDEKKESVTGDFYKDDFYPSGVRSMEKLSIDKEAGNGVFLSDDIVDFDPSVEHLIFNFNIVANKQYLKFNTDSIPSILSFVSGLQEDHHTKPIYPSSVIFQCMRYAEDKAESPGLVKNLLSLYLATIRNATRTTSGVVKFEGIKERKEKEKERKKSKDPQPIKKPVDIMTIGYWIAALNHLYYFLVRDVACDFFSKYPDLLQEIVSCLQLLTSKLALTMDEKLEPFIEECILKYNSVPDMDILYKNDWKIFKNKNKQPKTSFEEIVDVLYPPSITDQMKPSPIKIIQTLGALLYIMELYHINDLIKQQCLSSVLYWFGCSIFNLILENKKYCSRVKALEIRLNLSYIEDWLRSNNFRPFIDQGGDLSTVSSWRDSGFPDNLSGSKSPWLQHVARYNNNFNDPEDASYYYNYLYKIGHYTIQPILELTEWLQILSSLSDEQSIMDICENFETLNTFQLVQCIRNYNYEVDEKKFSKSLKNWLKSYKVQNSVDIYLFHKEDNKGEPLYLNALEIFPIVLPNTVQLLHQYGADFDHIDKPKFIAYQPNIPLELRDEIETIIEEFFEDDYRVEKKEEDESFNESDERNDLSGGEFAENRNHGYSTDHNDLENSNSDKDHGSREDEDIYKQVQEPSTPAWKSWEHENSNPWA